MHKTDQSRLLENICFLDIIGYSKTVLQSHRNILEEMTCYVVITN
jgi:hypothetical protein